MSRALQQPARTFRPVIAGFLDSMARFPGRPALSVDGAVLTYESLGRLAGSMAAAILAHDRSAYPLAALLAHRSVTAYAGVLAIHGAGKGYVPLNPKLPRARLLRVLERSGCRLLIADGECLPLLEALLPELPSPLTILLPELPDAADWSARFARHQFIAADWMAGRTGLPDAPPAAPSSPAYLLFTSGSTGEPKGVAVSQQNVRAYVEYVSERHQVTEYDRCSQSFDLSFDLSAHDLFVCWERGACLCVIPDTSVMAPAKFIRDQQLTMWFSVPSVVGVMSKLGMLKTGAFPSLRSSLFCGEPLPIAYAQAWADAAPNSIVENVYGPTEATIAITHYRWDRAAPPDSPTGIVPIGRPFDGQRVCVVDSKRRPLAPGERGELCLAGSQITAGYWNNPAKTAEQFVTLPGAGDGPWYRTGDLVRQDDAGCLHYLGRIDHQVKIRGYRVELQEVEGALRQAAGTGQVVAMAWPVRDGIADGIVAFVCGGRDRDARRILQACKETLPDYMIPKTLHFVDELPLNVHGKVDRLALLQRLQEPAP